MPNNRGRTSLKCKRSRGNAMRAYDRLAPDLRAWVANAMLPWRAGSVESAFAKALAKTGSRSEALKALDQMQNRLLAKDGVRIWGDAYPTDPVSPSDHSQR